MGEIGLDLELMPDGSFSIFRRWAVSLSGENRVEIKGD
jgi:hypothetical protein